MYYCLQGKEPINNSRKNYTASGKKNLQMIVISETSYKCLHMPAINLSQLTEPTQVWPCSHTGVTIEVCTVQAQRPYPKIEKPEILLPWSKGENSPTTSARGKILSTHARMGLTVTQDFTMAKLAILT